MVERDTLINCLEWNGWHYKNDNWSIGSDNDYCNVFIRDGRVWGAMTHAFNHEISDALKKHIELSTSFNGTVKVNHNEHDSVWVWYHEQEILDEDHLLEFAEICEQSPESFPCEYSEEFDE